MKARMSEKLRKLLNHPETARALQKALLTPRRLDPQSRAKTQGANGHSSTPRKPDTSTFQVSRRKYAHLPSIQQNLSRRNSNDSTS